MLATHAQALQQLAKVQPDATVGLCEASARAPALVAAAMSLHRAAVLDEAYSGVYSAALDGLPAAHRALLAEEGCEAVIERLQEEAVAALPPVRQPRTKYALYYDWIEKRIAESMPKADEGEVELLLLMPADELNEVLERAGKLRLAGAAFESTVRAIDKL